MHCQNCFQQFTITSQDREFYSRIKVDEPSLCPRCRRQRRMAHRNERFLYSRTCDLCKKNIISQYKPGTNLTVYCRDCWWSDQWDPLQQGQDFDSSRPFFDQWHELIFKTPQLALLDLKSENSDYIHLTSNNKNCYLIFSSDYNEQCYYSNWMLYSQNCIDCFHITKSEQCYQCFFGDHLYSCQFLIQCFSSNESSFCYDCRNIQNCTLCYNLRNKQYCILNKQYSQAEYNKKIEQLNLNTLKGQEQALKQFQQLFKTKAIHSFRNQLGRIEKSVGDYLANTKDCNNCFDLNESEKCSHVSNMTKMKDSYDCEFGGEGELGYENVETFPMPRNSIGTINTYAGNDAFYSFNCMRSKNIFGCASLKKQEHCILNKKYSESEFARLKTKIIEYMKKTREWGEFMPIKYSLFAYNETNAQDYFPLTKKQVIEKKYKWHEQKNKINKDLTQCNNCQKNFKLIPQEIKFYKQHSLPEPEQCYQCRYSERLTWRNKNIIHDRTCDKCQKQIQSTYSQNREERVYCSQCYRKEVY